MEKRVIQQQDFDRVAGQSISDISPSPHAIHEVENTMSTQKENFKAQAQQARAIFSKIDEFVPLTDAQASWNDTVKVPSSGERNNEMERNAENTQNLTDDLNEFSGDYEPRLQPSSEEKPHQSDKLAVKDQPEVQIKFIQRNVMSNATTFSNMSSNPDMLNQKLAQDLLHQQKAIEMFQKYQNNNNADLAELTDLNENSSMFQMRCEQDHSQMKKNDPYQVVQQANQPQQQNHQNSQQFSFKEEQTENTNSNSEQIERNVIDQLMENNQNEVFLEENEEQKFQFRDNYSPSDQSNDLHEIQQMKLRQIQNSDDISDDTAVRHDMVGRMLSINVTMGQNGSQTFQNLQNEYPNQGQHEELIEQPQEDEQDYSQQEYSDRLNNQSQFVQQMQYQIEEIQETRRKYPLEDMDIGCIGEDDLLEQLNDASRENTEIDFIHQIDTDRQLVEQEVEEKLPVANDNQIEIKSKQQEHISEQIYTKPAKGEKQEDKEDEDRPTKLPANEPLRSNKSRPSSTKRDQSKLNDSAWIKPQAVSSFNPKAPSKSLYTEVYVWGSDSHGQLGLELHNKNSNIQQPKDSFYHIAKSCSFNVILTQVSCGKHHTAMLTQNGHLYMMGSNKFGQLGFAPRSNDDQVRAPCLVDSLKAVKIKEIECGDNHNVVMGIKRDGSQPGVNTVYSWGYNNSGQVGAQRDQSIIPTPEIIMQVKKSQGMQISCGQSHSLILVRAEGQVDIYACGANSFGQCALPLSEAIHVPTQIQMPNFLDNKVSQIATGKSHSLFLCGQTGFVYECGTYQKSTKLSKFKQIHIQEPIQRISAKIYSAALSYSGHVYVWGKSNESKSKGPILPLQIFNQVQNHPIKSVALGEKFAVIVDSKAKAYAWDLLQQQNNTQLTSLSIKNIKNMECGDNFLIALGRDVEKSALKKNQKKKSSERASVQVQPQSQQQNKMQEQCYPSVTELPSQQSHFPFMKKQKPSIPKLQTDVQRSTRVSKLSKDEHLQKAQSLAKLKSAKAVQIMSTQQTTQRSKQSNMLESQRSGQVNIQVDSVFEYQVGNLDQQMKQADTKINGILKRQFVGKSHGNLSKAPHHQSVQTKSEKSKIKLGRVNSQMPSNRKKSHASQLSQRCVRHKNVIPSNPKKKTKISGSRQSSKFQAQNERSMISNKSLLSNQSALSRSSHHGTKKNLKAKSQKSLYGPSSREKVYLQSFNSIKKVPIEYYHDAKKLTPKSLSSKASRHSASYYQKMLNQDSFMNDFAAIPNDVMRNLNRSRDSRQQRSSQKSPNSNVSVQLSRKEMTYKMRRYKQEVKALASDNIKKDNNIQRLAQQVERLKRGLPKKNHQSMLDLQQQKNNEQMKAQESEIKQLKNKVKKYQLKQQQQNATSKPKNQDITSDLFVANEQNCELQDKINKLQLLVREKEKHLEDQKTKVLKLEEKIKKKDQKLLQANSELDELQAGIKDFQEQTHAIQTELIQKIQKLQDQNKNTLNQNDQLKYDIQVLKKAQVGSVERQRYDKNRADDNVKDHRIAKMKKDNRELQGLVAKLSSQLEKQNYNEVMLKMGGAGNSNLKQKKPQNSYGPSELMSPQKVSKSVDRKSHHMQSDKSLTPSKYSIQSKFSIKDRQSIDVINKSLKRSLLFNNQMDTYQVQDKLILSQASKRSFEKYDPQADIKSMLSEKLRTRKEKTLSKERQYEMYVPKKDEAMVEVSIGSPGQNTYAQPPPYVPKQLSSNMNKKFQESNSPVKKQKPGYHDDVKNYQSHSYLSRMGEVNRQTKQQIEVKQKPQSTRVEYFNTGANKQQSLQPQDPTISVGTGGTIEVTEEQKEQSIRELREKYNNMMKKSLERKATVRQMKQNE